MVILKKDINFESLLKKCEENPYTEIGIWDDNDKYLNKFKNIKDKYINIIYEIDDIYCYIEFKNGSLITITNNLLNDRANKYNDIYICKEVTDEELQLASAKEW